MSLQGTSPGRLAIQLAIYFAVLMGVMIVLAETRPGVLDYLPLGGTNALTGVDVTEMKDSLSDEDTEPQSPMKNLLAEEDAVSKVTHISLFVIGHLTGTLIIMMPITWTYRAINFETGFSKTFVRALIVLPICATTTVLLIQDSLALAFGLAALVAAVRFRVSLDEAMDGIFIFAAICVGLAAGIGYLGVAIIMSIFFCFANLFLWMSDYGRNPVDDMKRKKRRDKLQPAGTESSLRAP
ncbi:MAG: hypothetical protein O6931_03485 [Gammaproteobacteria bacterium]|nr:hypothetical protein [Gammaproteobacteria bacterium]